jgi:hypothetical protein
MDRISKLSYLGCFYLLLIPIVLLASSNVGAQDNNIASVSAQYNSAVNPFAFKIGSFEQGISGTHVYIPVTKTSGTEEIWGFDFLIGYDASALNFMGAIAGVLFNIPPKGVPDTLYQWEYFNYRFGPDYICNGICPSGLLRVVAIADQNDGAHHPITKILPDSIVLFKLDFIISNNWIYECMYIPIRFIWIDCDDNTVAFRYRTDGTGYDIKTGISDKIYDSLNARVDSTDATFPTRFGAPDSCLIDVETEEVVSTRFVDFWNGGVSMYCSDTVTAKLRGDVNFNKTPYEIRDFLLFRDYFLLGETVFIINKTLQIRASDINGDGIPLTFEDFILLWRIIEKKMTPDSAIDPPFAGELKLIKTDSSFIIRSDFNKPIGGLFFCLNTEGSVSYDKMTDNSLFYYSRVGDSLKILLVDSIGSGEQDLFRVSYKNNNSSIPENCMAAGYYGEKATVTTIYEDNSTSALPIDFDLEQNYPNPFNAATAIRFRLFSRGGWNLNIFNIQGQKVRSISGNDFAGPMTILWDGTNDSGQPLSSGVYFYRLRVGDYSHSKKMLLLK